MRIVLQDLAKGKTWLESIPLPSTAPGEILVRTTRSVLSPGTERMLVEFGRSSLIGKARAQPARLRQVIDKARTDGWRPTLDAVRAKLGDPIPMGYCAAGVVEDGNGTSLVEGTRVATNGFHGEYVLVGENLAAPIPDQVSDDAAAFTPLASIALQGLRLAAPTLGETVFVSGLGVVGLLAVQLLRANGCRVLAGDFVAERLALAKSFGAMTIDLSKGSDPVEFAMDMTGGLGVDAVLVAAATKSSDPMKQAAAMARQRGRIVLLGVAGLEFDRDPFFKKELTFQVSCSYGPGRYDREYESGQTDFPIGHVRWTIRRNFEAVLELMASGSLDPLPLISHRFPFSDAPQAYDLLSSESSPLGVVLEYEEKAPIKRHPQLIHLKPKTSERGRPTISVVGAGNFTRRIILPALEKSPCRRRMIVSRQGISAAVSGKKFGFEHASTNPGLALSDKETSALFITTRHDTHAELAIRALRAGKDVFVEKPLAITLNELADLSEELGKPESPRLMVGFNRRFSPHAIRVRDWCERRGGPVAMDYLVNAGKLPPGSWQGVTREGGGRIIGELCHFVDLVTWLSGSVVNSVVASGMIRSGKLEGDSTTVLLSMENGSLATIHYWANGPAGFPKERLTVMCRGQAAEIYNFRRTGFTGTRADRDFRTAAQDKGHNHEITQFLDCLESGKPTPIPEGDSIMVTLVTFAVMEAIASGERQYMADWQDQLGKVGNKEA
ncbi:MAG: bi-domain-containing oxidoreductase [Candidatus Sumerlaeia bacterium]|nr:bi-domain-containing oxidoreductase [Candidatus Sumerlaeia bacterium]